jgi:hypothetical protein
MIELFLILIGINIGVMIGWVLSKEFDGNVEKLMKWFDG